MSIIALIPARAGSTRIPGKNTKLLNGVPLIAYTIAAAKQSGIFSQILVSTNDPVAGQIAKDMGVIVSVRPEQFATAESPDIAWVKHVMGCDAAQGVECFSILRPTSPFRTAATIQRAWEKFRYSDADSMRAVEPWTGHHPGKMWTYSNAEVRLYPVMNEWTAHAPYHSSPTQSLIRVVRQNASLEMAKARVLHADPPTIAGTDIMPFWTEGHEGFDINTPEDWAAAERMARDIQWWQFV